MASVLITGSNRGIGLGLVKQILNQDGPIKTVIATCRNPDMARELIELKKNFSNLHILKLDVSKLDSFKNFTKEVELIVGENGLNILINNAGINLKNKFGDFKTITPDEYMELFTTNTLGPIFLIQALLPEIQKAAKKNSNKAPSIHRAAILNMSSFLGSISDNNMGSYWAYRETKSALNQFSRSLAKDLASDKIIVTVLHPGHVRTDMGGPSGKISVEESVTGIYKLMMSLDENKSDKFFQWDGKELPW